MSAPTDPNAQLEEVAAIARGVTAHLERAQALGRKLWPTSPLPPKVAVEPAVGGPAVAAAAGASTSAASLADVRQEIGDCKRCGLHAGRKHIVFGVGSESADLMFVGEAPGRDEDVQGEPFVGRAGELLTKMIGAMGLNRNEVYISNIIKCRPPNNRDPQPDEVSTCEPFLLQQISIVKPSMIVALGNFAAKTLLRTQTGITRLRGRFHDYHGTPLMPTFHPAYLLRDPTRKRPVWTDLQLVMKEMDRLGLSRRRD